MPLDLVTITLVEDQTILDLIQIDESISKDVDEFAKAQVNSYAKLALNSFQSVVPIYSRQLRDSHIQVDFAKKNQAITQAKVYVSDAIHTSSPRPTGPGRTYLKSSMLAEVLNTGKDKYRGTERTLMRSRPSDPAGLSGPTAGWIDKGYNRFLSAI